MEVNEEPNLYACAGGRKNGGGGRDAANAASDLLSTAFRYEAVEEHLESEELGSYTTYAICAYAVCAGEQIAVDYVSDVSCDEAFAEDLALRCTSNSLEPIHLRDVILDQLV